MKKILLVSTALLISAPALAGNTDNDDVFVTASVAEECSIEDLGTIALGDISIVETPGANALQVLNGASKDSDLIYVSCNYNNKMTLSTPTPLVAASAAGLGKATGSADFTNEIQYHFRAVNYANSPDANSATQPSVTSNSSAPIHKQIKFRAYVNAADQNGARPYAANDYKATANISITTI